MRPLNSDVATLRKSLLISSLLTLVFAIVSWDSAARDIDPPHTAHLSDSRFMDWGGVNGIPGWAHAVLEDDQGLLWISTSDGLVRFDGVSFRLMAFTSDKYSEFRRLFQIDGQIYVGDHDKPLHRYRADLTPARLELLPWQDSLGLELHIWSSYNHHDGRVFLSDHDGQIYEYLDATQGVELFFDMLSVPHGRSEIEHTAREIRADPFDTDRVWVCSKQGLFHIDVNTKEYQFYRPRDQPQLQRLSTDDSYAFHDHIQIGKNIWISSYGNGLVRFNTEDFSWKAYRYEPPYHGIRENANFILSHISHSDRYIILGGRDMKIFDVEEEKFVDFRRHHGGYNAASIPTVQMYRAGESLYVIAGGILSELSQEHNQFLTGDLNRTQAAANESTITAVAKIDEERVIITDRDQRSYSWNTRDLSIVFTDSTMRCSELHPERPSTTWEYDHPYIIVSAGSAETRQIEVASNSNFSGLRSLLLSGNDQAWMTTQAGIIRYNFTDSSYQVYDKRHGLLTNDWSENGILTELEDGFIFASSASSFAYFHPDQLRVRVDSGLTPFVYSIDVYDQERLSCSDTDETIGFTLEAEENYFSIYYSAMDHVKSRAVEFQYRLSPYDKSWQSGSPLMSAVYSDVPPDDYRFHLRCRYEGGDWVVSQQDVTILAKPTFTESMYFRLIIAAGITSLFVFLFRYRVRMIRDEERLHSAFREELAEVKLEALRSQMNPHFLFNSLNSIDHYILNNRPRQASEYLSKFSKLVRKILEFSKRKRITLDDELETLKHYIQMEQMRFQERFEYKVVVEKDVLTTALYVPPLLLQPYAENAVWHGMMHLEDRVGLLTIRISLKDRDVIIEIEDNGIGRVKSKAIKPKSATKRKSYGIKINEDRIRLNNELRQIGGSVDIRDNYNEYGHPIGTSVTVSLPIDEDENTAYTV